MERRETDRDRERPWSWGETVTVTETEAETNLKSTPRAVQGGRSYCLFLDTVLFLQQ